jgi:hypothetical protein
MRASALIAALGLALLAPAASSADTAEARVRLTERCSYRPLTGNGLALETNIRLRNIGGVAAVVRVIAGWTIERHYPKAKSARTVRLAAGRTVAFTVTRRIPHAPVLRAALAPPVRFDCASRFTLVDPPG